MRESNKKMIQLKTQSLVDVKFPDGSTKQYPRAEVRIIDGEAYLPDVTCFRVKNSAGKYIWNRFNNGLIAYNCEDKTWNFIKNLNNDPNITRGVYNEKGDIGYFKLNPFENIFLCDDENYSLAASTICINKEIATKAGYIEHVGHGVWINKSRLTSSTIRDISTKKVLKYARTGINYNADESNNTYLNILAEYNESKKFIKIGGRTESASKLLGNYTFGFEIETSNGTVPKNILGPLGLVPLKDGSLRDAQGIEPYEYTSIPLNGEKGLETLKLISAELSKRCDFNNKCSVHIHISGVSEVSEAFCIALYKLGMNIQNEVYSLFPKYKTNPELFVPDFRKNYCAPLITLGIGNKEKYIGVNKTTYDNAVKNDFSALYTYLTDNTTLPNAKYNLHTFLHPKGNTQKWNFHARYHFMNLVSFVFTRKRTVEFRLHTPTTHFTKLSAWLFICAAILRFTEKNVDKILKDEIKYDLNTILDCYSNNFGNPYKDEYGIFVAEYLKEYCALRKRAMKTDFENRSDAYGNSIDFAGESKFKFMYAGSENIY